jgi:hypothetical protein
MRLRGDPLLLVGLAVTLSGCGVFGPSHSAAGLEHLEENCARPTYAPSECWEQRTHLAVSHIEKDPDCCALPGMASCSAGFINAGTGIATGVCEKRQRKTQEGMGLRSSEAVSTCCEPIVDARPPDACPAGADTTGAACLSTDDAGVAQASGSCCAEPGRGSCKAGYAFTESSAPCPGTPEGVWTCCSSTAEGSGSVDPSELQPARKDEVSESPRREVVP